LKEAKVRKQQKQAAEVKEKKKTERNSIRRATRQLKSVKKKQLAKEPVTEAIEIENTGRSISFYRKIKSNKRYLS
jgi:hypothetical protein